MRKIDKNTCFDLKQLSLFVKSELSDGDLDKISKHLEDCAGCSETVENVKSFYFIDSEEKLADFSSSKKELTFISFKYILKEKFALLANKIGEGLTPLSSSSSNIGSRTVISSGSKPVLNFSTSVILSIIAMFFCISILYSPISRGLILNKETTKDENDSEQLVYKSFIAYKYKEKNHKKNRDMHTYGILNCPFDNTVRVRNGGILAILN